ncbi:hypothetical protein Mterra_03926 [Calidithermus terrae]|uniref:Uncharacterized protein n=1 Tax=Calidithermus terrae TaxID=1408545 RepID=A0A399DWL0_9DEIN|nr:hypothetical protein Mterra_03926 [Calidithermus terrae]
MHRVAHGLAQQRQPAQLALAERAGVLDGHGEHPDRPRARQQRDHRRAPPPRDVPPHALPDPRVGGELAHEEGLAPAQRPAGEALRPGHGRRREGEVGHPAPAGVVLEGPLVGVVEQQVARGGVHEGEGLVEGGLEHGPQPVGAAQRLAHAGEGLEVEPVLLGLGDVERDREHRRLPAELDAAGGVVEPARLPRPAHDAEGVAAHHRLAAQPGEPALADGGPVLRVDQVPEGPGLQLLQGVAGGLEHRRVGVDDAVLLPHQDQGRRGVGQGAEERLALAQGPLGLLLLGDVAHVEHHPLHRRLVKQVAPPDVRPAHRAGGVEDARPVGHGLARPVQQALEPGLGVGAVVGVDEVEDVEGPVQVAQGVVAQHLPDVGADVAHDASGVDDVDEVGGVLDQGAEAVLQAGPLADVDDAALVVHQLPAPPVNRPQVLLDPQHLPVLAPQVQALGRRRRVGAEVLEEALALVGLEVEPAGVQPGQFVRGVAAEGREGRVGLEHAPVGPLAVHPHGHRVEELPVAQALGPLAQRALHRRPQPRQVPGGLEHVVLEAAAHGLDRHLLRAAEGEHDHRQVRVSGLDPAEDLQAVGEAQVVVGDDRVEVGAVQGLGEALRRLRDGQLQAQGLQAALGQQPVGRVVLDQQDAGHRGQF